MEGNKLDMANRMANTANAFLVCIFYTPILPWAPVAATLGMFLSYWIEKYLLVRRHTRPEEMSGTMIHFFANLIPYMVLLWGIALRAFPPSIARYYFSEAYYTGTGEETEETADFEVDIDSFGIDVNFSIVE